MVSPHEHKPQTSRAFPEATPSTPDPEQDYEVTSALKPTEASQLRLVALIMAGSKQRLGGHILSEQALRSRSV